MKTPGQKRQELYIQPLMEKIEKAIDEARSLTIRLEVYKDELGPKPNQTLGTLKVKLRQSGWSLTHSAFDGPDFDYHYYELVIEET